MPSLKTAVSFPQSHSITMLIRKDLNLNMPRGSNILLNQHHIIPKRISSLTLGTLQLIQKLLLIKRNSHALPTTTLNCLNHNRKPNLPRLLQQIFRFLIDTMISRYTRHTSLDHNILTPALVPHVLNRLPRRSNEHQPLFHTPPRKRGILTQESISWM